MEFQSLGVLAGRLLGKYMDTMKILWLIAAIYFSISTIYSFKKGKFVWQYGGEYRRDENPLEFWCFLCANVVGILILLGAAFFT